MSTTQQIQLAQAIKRTAETTNAMLKAGEEFKSLRDIKRQLQKE